MAPKERKTNGNKEKEESKEPIFFEKATFKLKKKRDSYEVTYDEKLWKPLQKLDSRSLGLQSEYNISLDQSDPSITTYENTATHLVPLAKKEGKAVLNSEEAFASATQYTEGNKSVFVFKSNLNDHEAWIFPKDMTLEEAKKIVDSEGDKVEIKKIDTSRTKPAMEKKDESLEINENERKLQEINEFAMDLQDGIKLSDLNENHRIRQMYLEVYGDVEENILQEVEIPFDITDLDEEIVNGRTEIFVNIPTWIQELITKNTLPYTNMGKDKNIFAETGLSGLKKEIDLSNFANSIQKIVDQFAIRISAEDRSLLNNKLLKFGWFVNEEADDKISIIIEAITPKTSLTNLQEYSLEITLPKFDLTNVQQLFQESLYENASTRDMLINQRQFNQLRYESDSDYTPTSHMMIDSNFRSVNFDELDILTKYLQRKVLTNENKEFFVYNPYLHSTEAINIVEKRDEVPNTATKNAYFDILANSVAMAMDYYRDKGYQPINGTPQYQIREQGDYWRVDIIFVDKNGHTDESSHFVISSDPDLERVVFDAPFDLVDLRNKQETKLVNGEIIYPEKFDEVTPSELFKILEKDDFSRCSIEGLSTDLTVEYDQKFYLLISEFSTFPNHLNASKFILSLKKFPNLAIQYSEDEPPQILVLNIIDADTNNFEEVLLITKLPSKEETIKTGNVELVKTTELNEHFDAEMKKLHDQIWTEVISSTKLDSDIVQNIRDEFGETSKAALTAFAQQKLEVYLHRYQQLLTDKYHNLQEDPENKLDLAFAKWISDEFEFDNISLEEQLFVLSYREFSQRYIELLKSFKSDATGDDILNSALGSEFDPDRNRNGNFNADDISSLKKNLPNLLEEIFVNNIIFKSFNEKVINLLTPETKTKKRRLLWKVESTRDLTESEILTQTIFNALDNEFKGKLINSAQQEQLEEVIKQAYIGILASQSETDSNILSENLSPLQLNAAELIIQTLSYEAEVTRFGKTSKMSVNVFDSKYNENLIIKIDRKLNINSNNKNSISYRYDKLLKKLIGNDRNIDKELAKVKEAYKNLADLFNNDDPETFPIQQFLNLLNSKEDTLEKIILEAQLHEAGILLYKNAKTNKKRDRFKPEPKSIGDLIDNVDIANDQQRELNKLRINLSKIIQQYIDDNPNLENIANSQEFIDLNDTIVNELPEYWQDVANSLEVILKKIAVEKDNLKKLLILSLLSPKDQSNKDKIKSKIINKYLSELEDTEAIINNYLNKTISPKFMRTAPAISSESTSMPESNIKKGIIKILDNSNQPISELSTAVKAAFYKIKNESGFSKKLNDLRKDLQKNENLLSWETNKQELLRKISELAAKEQQTIFEELGGSDENIDQKTEERLARLRERVQNPSQKPSDTQRNFFSRK